MAGGGASAANGLALSDPPGGPAEASTQPNAHPVLSLQRQQLQEISKGAVELVRQSSGSSRGALFAGMQERFDCRGGPRGGFGSKGVEAPLHDRKRVSIYTGHLRDFGKAGIAFAER